MAERPEISIVCRDPSDLSALAGRVFVADSIEIVPSDACPSRDLIEHKSGVLVPGPFRPATDDEITRYAVGPDDEDKVRWPLHIVKVPDQLIQDGIDELRPRRGKIQLDPTPDQAIYTDARGVLKDRWVNAGYDPLGAEATCMAKHKSPDPDWPRDRGVGMHHDVYDLTITPTYQT